MPPWSWMRLAVSVALSPAGTGVLRNSPISSPSIVKTSSPTITRVSPARWSSSAPSMESWSVTKTGSRPSERQRLATLAGGSEQSNDAEVCRWRSTRNSRGSLGSHPEHGVDGAVASAQCQRGLDRSRDERLGRAHGFSQRSALGQLSGDGGREDAAAAVGVGGREPLPRQFQLSVARYQ